MNDGCLVGPQVHGVVLLEVSSRSWTTQEMLTSIHFTRDGNIRISDDRDLANHILHFHASLSIVIHFLPYPAHRMTLPVCRFIH